MANLTEEKNRIGVSVTAKKNLGNYESLDVGAWISNEVGDVHDQEEWKKIWTEVEEQIKEQLSDVGTDD